MPNWQLLSHNPRWHHSDLIWNSYNPSPCAYTRMTSHRCVVLVGSCSYRDNGTSVIMLCCHSSEAAVLSSREKDRRRQKMQSWGGIDIKMDTIREKRHLYVTPCIALCCAHRQTTVLLVRSCHVRLYNTLSICMCVCLRMNGKSLCAPSLSLTNTHTNNSLLLL